MSTFLNDLKYALRMLAKCPGFTAIALITLALGIGANTLMYSMADSLLLLKPRKVKHPEGMVLCSLKGAGYDTHRYFGYQTIRDSDLAFKEVAAQSCWAGGAALVHHAVAHSCEPSYVSSNYFEFLGVSPVSGRGFRPEEEQIGTEPVVVLSDHLWQRLGRDPNLIDQFIPINGVPCRVVGIMPEGFVGPAIVGKDLWLSLGSYRQVDTGSFNRRTRPPDASLDWDYPHLHIMGRLKPGLTMSAAQAQLQSLTPWFQAEYSKQWKKHTAFSLHSTGRFTIDITEEQTHVIFSIFSLVVISMSTLILVIACLNLANMLMIQGASRQREFAVRLAIGGQRWRIIRQLFTEAFVLAFFGGALGVLLALVGTRVFNSWTVAAPNLLTRYLHLTLNHRVLAITLGICVIATVLFGLRPATCLSKRDIVGSMKANSASVLGLSRRRRTGVSVAGQIAMAVLLVLCAALMTHSALNVAKPDPRYCLEDKLVVKVDPHGSGLDSEHLTQMYRDLIHHVAALPGITSVGTSHKLFYGGGGPIMIREFPPGGKVSGLKRRSMQRNAFVQVGQAYFKAMEIPLLRGRYFQTLDRVPEAEPVAIIDESLARKLRPDGNALDCIIQWTIPEAGQWDDEPYRVIGIVANVSGVRERDVYGQMYVPTSQDALSSFLYVKVENRNLVGDVQHRLWDEIHRVAPRLPVFSIKTLAQARDEDSLVWAANTGARLAMCAGGIALFLAALGIYAIKGYTVASSTAEIGIRMALGATQALIIRRVLYQGMILTLVGMMVGLGLGLALAKLGTKLLYELTPLDPISILVTVGLLGTVSLLASYIPARRAARIDPMEALRYE
jgi:predicted permease